MTNEKIELEKFQKQIDDMLDACKRCVYRKTNDMVDEAKHLIKELLFYIDSIEIPAENKTLNIKKLKAEAKEFLNRKI